MVSVSERKRLYSILLPNTHTLIHNIKSHPADSFFFFFNPQIDGSGKKKGSATDSQKKKKRKEKNRGEKSSQDKMEE